MSSGYAEAVNYVDVRCPSCGGRRSVTDRQHRRLVADGSDFKCRLCRTQKEITVTEDDRNYWLERFSKEEIRELGMLIWGTP